jgi:streptomycin 6-kinase
MKILTKNIINLYQQQGQDWLNDIPKIIQALAQHWLLTDIKPVDNMSWHYVATAKQQQQSVVIKISCDKQLNRDEYRALQHFNAHGMVRVLAIDKEYNALLLQQAIPGILLKDNHTAAMDEVIDIYATVVKQLAGQSCNNNDKFTNVSCWLKAIDRMTDSRINPIYIEKAKQLRMTLLDTAQSEYVCHGDLHLENIIQHQSTWLAIDPKGIIGEMAFEVAAFDIINDNELQQSQDISTLILKQLNKLANALNLEVNRLLCWYFLRVIMSAQWFIEDNGDPSNRLVLAKHLYSLLK